MILSTQKLSSVFNVSVMTLALCAMICCTKKDSPPAVPPPQQLLLAKSLVGEYWLFHGTEATFVQSTSKGLKMASMKKIKPVE